MIHLPTPADLETAALLPNLDNPSLEQVAIYIEIRLLHLNKTLEDQEAVQQMVLELISRARLTTDVFNKLRGTEFIPRLWLIIRKVLAPFFL